MRTELHQALRACAAHRIVALTVIVVTALGFGAFAALAAVMKRTLVDPLPYRQPHQLVRIGTFDRSRNMTLPVPQITIDAWRGVDTLTAVAAYSIGRPTLQRDLGAEALGVVYVGDGYDRLLGIAPLYGRPFRAEEFQRGNDAVLLLSHDGWYRLFNGDPSIVGRTLRIDDRAVSVIGVLPPTSFEFPRGTFAFDAWMPLALDPARPNSAAEAVARLREGVSAEAAHAELTPLFRSTAPERLRDRDVRVVGLSEDAAGRPRNSLLLVFAALLGVVLVACVNVALLLLARGEERRRDFAVMAAIGASRGRMLRRILLENELLALTGAAIGLACSPMLMRAFLAIYPDLLAWRVDTSALVPIVPLVLGLAAVTGAVASLPLVYSLRGGSTLSLGATTRTTATRGAQRLRWGLLAGQIALSLALLAAAAKLGQLYVRLATIDPGYDESVTAFAMGMLQRDRSPERASQFFEELVDTLGRRPEIRGVALSNNLPSRMGMTAPNIRFAGVEVSADYAPLLNIVSPSYAGTLGLRTLQGRYLEPTDRAGSAPVAVVNARLAQDAFGTLDVVGRTFLWSAKTWTIVGVVSNVRQRGPFNPVDPAVHVSRLQQPDIPIWVLVKPAAASSPVNRAIRESLAAVDRHRIAPLHTYGRLDERVDELLRRERFAAGITGSLSALAVGLVALGIYGSLAYAVDRKRREIAIRIALGVAPGRVTLEVLREAAAIAIVGLIGGLLLQASLDRWLSSLVTGFAPGLTPSTGMATLVLLAVAVAGAWLPARRAARLDPSTALRSE